MKKLFLILIGVILCSSCKNKESEYQSDSPQLLTQSTQKNCLTNLNLKYDELLSLNEVAQILNLSSTELKTKTNDRKDEYGEVYYLWSSDRPDQPSPISQHVMLPDENFVSLSGLSAYDEDWTGERAIETFEMGYKQLSKSEMDAINENTKNHLEGKSKEEKELVEGLIEVRKNSNYEKIENFASSSFWKFSEERGGELIVLSGKEKFKIEIKISLNPKENLEMAKKLAETLLDKCF